MSSFSRFQQRNKNYNIAQGVSNARFIFEGYPSTLITDGQGNQKTAAVVNQQEKDCAYIYTKVDEPLAVGQVWETKGLHFLISEEIIVIKDVEWRKYFALLCNVQIGDIWGYFKGPEKAYINVTLKQNVMIQSQQKPILVLPKGTLKFEDKVVIGDRGWLVQESDSISTPGIEYYSVRAASISKEVIKQQQEEEKYAMIEEANTTTPQINPRDIVDEQGRQVHLVEPFTTIAISTEGAYFFTSTNEINILTHKENLVEFNLPYGVYDVEVKTKKDGEIVVSYYSLARE